MSPLKARDVSSMGTLFCRPDGGSSLFLRRFALVLQRCRETHLFTFNKRQGHFGLGDKRTLVRQRDTPVSCCCCCCCCRHFVCCCSLCCCCCRGCCCCCCYWSRRCCCCFLLLLLQWLLLVSLSPVAVAGCVLLLLLLLVLLSPLLLSPLCCFCLVRFLLHRVYSPKRFCCLLC